MKIITNENAVLNEIFSCRIDLEGWWTVEGAKEPREEQETEEEPRNWRIQNSFGGVMELREEQRN